MLKGKVQIDLHNHNTGLKDRIEQENMITDAISDIADAYAYFGQKVSSFSSLAPLCTSGLGGVILFDNTLTENVKNYHYPTEAKPIAFAGRYADNSTPYKGTLNVLESGWIDSDTYMNVWDFNTSQANGIIKSLSLCHKDTAVSPVTAYPVAIKQLGSGVTPLYLDYEDQTMYSIDYNYTSRYCNYIRNKEYTELPIGASFGAYEYSNDPVVSMPFPYPSPSYSGIFWNSGFWYYDGYVYVKYWRDTYYAAVAKIKVDTGATTLNFFDLGHSNYGRYFAVNNGYLYVSSNEWSGLRKYSLSDLSTYTTISTGITGSFIGCLDKDLLIHWNSSKTVVVYPDDSLYTFNGVYPEQNSVQYGLLNYYEGLTTPRATPMNNGNICVSRNYLGTICNLSQPVEKNSTTSMKVKYTITNA